MADGVRPAPSLDFSHELGVFLDVAIIDRDVHLVKAQAVELVHGFLIFAVVPQFLQLCISCRGTARSAPGSSRIP